MPCKQWNDQWVARIYDELPLHEEQRLEAHLEGCEECRRTLQELEESRDLLRESSPHVPVRPRVLVLRPSRFRQPAFAFASGLAAALLVFASGLFVGYGVSANRPGQTTAELEARLDADSSAREALLARMDSLEREVAAVSRTTRETNSDVPSEQLQAVLTRDEFDEAIQDLGEQLRLRQARDMEFLLDEMTTIERRAARWTDETREAVRMVALQQDPRYRER